MYPAPFFYFGDLRGALSHSCGLPYHEIEAWMTLVWYQSRNMPPRRNPQKLIQDVVIVDLHKEF